DRPRPPSALDHRRRSPGPKPRRLPDQVSRAASLEKGTASICCPFFVYSRRRAKADAFFSSAFGELILDIDNLAVIAREAVKYGLGQKWHLHGQIVGLAIADRRCAIDFGLLLAIIPDHHIQVIAIESDRDIDHG